jgi:hypothetical protein
MIQVLQATKLFFAQASLFENFAEGSCRQFAGMHRYIGLPSVRMA